MSRQPLIENVLYICMNSVCGLFAITGNTLILLAVYKTSRLQISSNYFICSLAANDVVVGVFINTINAVMVGLRLEPSKEYAIIFKLEQFFYVQTIVASTLNLCAVSIDRYIAISKPLRYPSIMTDQKCFRIILFIWSMSIICGIPAAFLDGHQGIFTLWAVVLIGGYVVPLSVITFCYARIMRIAHYQMTRIASSVRMRTSFESNHYVDVTVRSIRSQRAATTFALITLVFVVTFTPDLVIAVMFALKGEQKGRNKSKMVSLWLQFLLFTSSALNPVIYGFRNRELRLAAKNICTCSR